MKPNNPLSRETLLQIVHRSLDDTANHRDGLSGNGETLGTTVRQIMATLSTRAIADETEVENENVNAIPVPLFDVAAYVDGTLDDRAKEEGITRAAATDPGLMMEIVAAVRSRSEQPHPQLSSDLKSRLIAIQARELAKDPPSSDPIPTIRPVERHVASARNDRHRLNLNWNTFALVVTAAVLFFVVGWWVRSEVVPKKGQIANDPNRDATPESVPSAENDGVPIDRSNPDADRPLGDAILVEGSQPHSIPRPSLDPTDPVDRNPQDDVNPMVSDSPASNLAREDMRRDGRTPLAVEPSIGDPADSPGAPSDAPTVAPSTARSTQLVAEWSQIDGLLLRSISSGQLAASASYDSSPHSVVVGNTFDLASGEIGSRVRLQTLPWCRATAKLTGGGELVMAADTQIELTFGGAIELQYGSIAFLGLNENLVVRLGKNLANSIALESTPDGEIVVQKTVDGMQVDVTGQGVKVGGRPVTDSRLSVDVTSMQTARIDDAPERLPRWTRQRVDRIEVGRNVLAQLSESPDVRATMMKSLHSGAVVGEAAMTMRAWIVAASHDDFPRLIGSQDALLREAAMQHLRMIDPKDPRHRAFWQGLQTRAANPRTFASIRSYFVELWAQRRPNPTRRDQLLRMLQANEPATRVAANYLLRNFYGPGPPFDLNANAAARARTVNAWRTVISRVD